MLTTEKPIEIGGFALPAGTYSLFTVPAEDGSAKLVINKKTGQWGIPYNEDAEKANELARIDLKKTPLDEPVNQFTMALKPRVERRRARDDVGEDEVFGAVHREEISGTDRLPGDAHYMER